MAMCWLSLVFFFSDENGLTFEPLKQNNIIYFWMNFYVKQSINTTIVLYFNVDLGALVLYLLLFQFVPVRVQFLHMKKFISAVYRIWLHTCAYKFNAEMKYRFYSSYYISSINGIISFLFFIEFNEIAVFCFYYIDQFIHCH